MPKWILYGLAAVGDFVVAVITYRSGRIVFPIVLAFAGLCFVIAAAGAAMGKGRGRA